MWQFKQKSYFEMGRGAGARQFGDQWVVCMSFCFEFACLSVWQMVVCSRENVCTIHTYFHTSLPWNLIRRKIIFGLETSKGEGYTSWYPHAPTVSSISINTIKITCCFLWTWNRVWHLQNSRIFSIIKCNSWGVCVCVYTHMHTFVYLFLTIHKCAYKPVCL